MQSFPTFPFFFPEASPCVDRASLKEAVLTRLRSDPVIWSTFPELRCRHDPDGCHTGRQNGVFSFSPPSLTSSSFPAKVTSPPRPDPRQEIVTPPPRESFGKSPRHFFLSLNFPPSPLGRLNVTRGTRVATSRQHPDPCHFLMTNRGFFSAILASRCRKHDRTSSDVKDPAQRATTFRPSSSLK